MAKKYTCNECGYGWTSHKLFGEPAHCPSCHSRNIDKIGFLNTLDKLSDIIDLGISNKLNESFQQVQNETIKTLKENCSNCGIKFGEEGYYAKCSKWHFKSYSGKYYLCNSCAKKCKNCEKLFCLSHKVNHECK